MSQNQNYFVIIFLFCFLTLSSLPCWTNDLENNAYITDEITVGDMKIKNIPLKNLTEDDNSLPVPIFYIIPPSVMEIMPSTLIIKVGELPTLPIPTQKEGAN